MSRYVPDQNGELTALENFSTDVPQTIISAGDLGSTVLKMLLTLLFLVILLLATYWVIKKLFQNRLQKGDPDAAVQILEKRILSPKTMLYLVKVDEKKVLLAESHLEVRALKSFDP